MNPPRVAMVVQRYGVEINGGAELHARLLARRLRAHYLVDVLTSRALDYQRWDTHYPAGESSLDDCRVLRFDHPERIRGGSGHMPLRHKLRFLLRRWVAPSAAGIVLRPSGDEVQDGESYLKAKGPTMTNLMDYLRAHHQDYAALIFITAFFHPTAMGVLIDPGRSILVPTLHDEKGMYLPHYHRVFRAPRQIFYNTRAEQELAEQLYGADLAPGDVCGVGIDLPESTPASSAESAQRFVQLAARYRLDGHYLLYVGRVDTAKGCAELFRHFTRLREQMPGRLKLVVCGQLFMAAPTHPDIVLTGFVNDLTRDTLLEHATALVVPSQHESLSLSLLEGLAAGCPVIVNQHSAVLRQHVRDSGVGEVFADGDGFSAAVTRQMQMDPVARLVQRARGRLYVEQSYDWSHIIDKFRRAIEARQA